MSKFLHGTGAVRDMVLYLAAQFGKGLVVAFRLEDRIVAEALSSPTLTYDGTVDDAFETHPLSLPRGGIFIIFIGLKYIRLPSLWEGLRVGD